jgi:hypothetical protein
LHHHAQRGHDIQNYETVVSQDKKVGNSVGEITLIFLSKKKLESLVAHACNPSYLGGRDQEDHGLKPGPST